MILKKKKNKDEPMKNSTLNGKTKNKSMSNHMLRDEF